MVHRLPGEAAGNTAEAFWARRLRSLLRSLFPIDSPDIGVNHTLRGAELYLKRRGGAGGSKPVRFSITAVSGDYLTCVRVDEEGGSVRIAKPLKLRRSTYHTKTIDGLAYTANDDDGRSRSAVDSALSSEAGSTATVEEVLTPAYNAGDIIVADEPQGGTGVTLAGGELTWEDTNRDARTFQAPYRLNQVCINGQWKYILHRASEPFGNAS